MSIVEFIKEGFHAHKASGFKIILTIIAIIIFLFTGSAYVTSQHIQDQNAANSQKSVANHTETLAEIKNAVNELKANNAVDHQTTIKYINCVLVGITEAPSQTQALAVYQTCLANSQIPPGTGN